MTKPSKSSNEKLILGTIGGLILGFLIAFYALDYLPLAANTVLTVVITLIVFSIVLFLGFTWYRDKLVKQIFGKEIEFDNLINETKEVVDTVTVNGVDRLLKPLPKEQREKAKVLAPRIISYLFWSRFRNWGLRTLITFFVAVGGLVTTILLFNQNKLLEKQNEKIDYQINLEESTRRSSLVYLMGNIMDKIDEELKDTFNTNHGTRRLSPQLIGRIVALSQSLKPYRYLNTVTDSLTEPLSPERGQLFLSLINSGLDSTTLESIYSKIVLNKADLTNANLIRVNLAGANLAGANLSGAILVQTNLSNAILFQANLSGATMLATNLIDANLSDANLVGADLTSSNLSDAHLDHADLTGADLTSVTFHMPILMEANLTGATLNQAKGLTKGYLSHTKSLYNCKGLSPEIEKELRETHPHLFTKKSSK